MSSESSKGFTLVEMAIVLVVIGLLVGMGASMIGPLTTMGKVRESREVVEADIATVVSWAASNNRLPQWGDGVADATIDEFVEVAKKTTDAWGRPLIYLYDNNLFTPPSKDTICGRKTTSITIRQCLTANCTTTSGTDYLDTQNIAFVILSQGEDATTQTNISTTPVTSNPITGTVTVPAGTDDIVRWVTLDELRSKIGCQGAQLKIVNNELPYGYISNSYNANITADGGVPYTSAGKYRWCIQGAAPTLATKPIIKSSDGTTDIVYNADCISLAENSWIRGDYISLNLSVVVAASKAYTCKTASPVTPPTSDWSEVGGNWTATTNYSPSTTVVSGTNAYTCKQPHTSALVNQPPNGASWRNYWTLTGEQWVAGSYTPPTSTYNFTVFVRDNNDNDPNTPIPPTSGKGDNIASKTFVLTINP
jgi:prepilin-type N-terminal cleavage/methylation domain-containing protein